jgi:hypothetical protein
MDACLLTGKMSFFILHIYFTMVHGYLLPEVGNVTSKCNGVTRYRFCLAVTAINFRSDNGLNVNITMRSDYGFFMSRAITSKSNNFSPQHIALCNNVEM